MCNQEKEYKTEMCEQKQIKKTRKTQNKKRNKKNIFHIFISFVHRKLNFIVYAFNSNLSFKNKAIFIIIMRKYFPLPLPLCPRPLPPFKGIKVHHCLIKG